MQISPRRCAAGVARGAVVALCGAGAATAAPAAGVARAVLESVCSVEPGDGAALAGALDARLLSSGVEERRGQAVGWRSRLALDGDREVVVVQIAPGGVLAAVSFEVSAVDAGALPRPELFVSADGRCAVRRARRIRYDAAGAPEAIEELDGALETVVAGEPINPPVPAGSDPGGVRVAMVDSGVDYRIAAIAARLARDEAGAPLGYDFWDLDDRPFDADSPTPFSVRRHGTRTASIMLAEAPVATLVAYRYPRLRMDRMGALVERAAADGVRVMNLSLGSNDRERWSSFEAAARANPQMLFVVSAGNDWLDIDTEPVFPAALDLDNILTVTSAEDDGSYAEASNHGVERVDVAVAAERRVATEFGGAARVVSGSSYAAARISALAACLLGAHPHWGASELKRAVVDLARPIAGPAFTAHGFIDEPTVRARGACPGEPGTPVVTRDQVFPGPAPFGAPTHALRLQVVAAIDAGWPDARIETAVGEAAALLAQCAVAIVEQRLRRVRLPREIAYYDRERARRLVAGLEVERPAVFLLRDSVERPAFDGVAIGRSNARFDYALADTVWLTAAVEPAGVGLAHELVHVLTDSGGHVDDPDNLMHARIAGGTALTDAQCRTLRERGVTNGLLHALAGPARATGED